MCTHAVPDWNAAIAFQTKIMPYLSKIQLVGTGEIVGGQARQALEGVLGSQFTYEWLDNQRLGWTVAFSPGTHDATSARAAFRAALAGRLTSAEVDYLDSTLLLVPTPHALAELKALQAPLFALLQSERDLFSGFGLGCSWSDGVRVQVSVGSPETPEVRRAGRGAARAVRRPGARALRPGLGGARDRQRQAGTADTGAADAGSAAADAEGPRVRVAAEDVALRQGRRRERQAARRSGRRARAPEDRQALRVGARREGREAAAQVPAQHRHRHRLRQGHRAGDRAADLPALCLDGDLQRDHVALVDGAGHGLELARCSRR